jgi:hemoglobin
MKSTCWITAVVAVGLVSAGFAAAGDAPTVEEQVDGLVEMCAASESARTARHDAKPLYSRLGGYDGVHALTTEVVPLHSINPDFARFWGDIDEEALIKNLDDFIATGTGGPKGYEGRDMPTAHAHLELSEADFLSAGGDVMAGMQNLGYGEDEIQEFVCILVSMKDLVITR